MFIFLKISSDSEVYDLGFSFQIIMESYFIGLNHFVKILNNPRTPPLFPFFLLSSLFIFLFSPLSSHSSFFLPPPIPLSALTHQAFSFSPSTSSSSNLTFRGFSSFSVATKKPTPYPVSNSRGEPPQFPNSRTATIWSSLFNFNI